MLEKVFSNLISNALRYGKTITSITFTGDVQMRYSGLSARMMVRESQKKTSPGSLRGVLGNTPVLASFSREILSITGFTIAETSEPAAAPGSRSGSRPGWRFRKT